MISHPATAFTAAPATNAAANGVAMIAKVVAIVVATRREVSSLPLWHLRPPTMMEENAESGRR